jgi:predicted acetyltransferase
MPASKLVRPDEIYKESFLSALKEYHSECRLLKELDYKTVCGQFDHFIQDLNEEMGEHHQNLEEWAERVPEIIYWLVKDGEFLGYIKIRKRVNWHLERYGGHISFSIRPSMRGKGFGKKILQKALPQTSTLGIEKALFTISPDNGAAKRIVEFCGGTHQDQTTRTDRFPCQMRYWLTL